MSINKRESIIFATHNEDKMKEIREIFKDLNVNILSLKDLKMNQEVEETGNTFEENAILKAKEIAKKTGMLVLADDSGLEVDYLNKMPGIYSARFLGEETSYNIKNQYIIDKLKDAKNEERAARFVCVIACVFQDGELITRKGVIEGQISKEIIGENGFGYDPIFYVVKYKCTTGQMSPEEKNKVSHRGIALEKIKSVFKERGLYL